MDGRLLDDVSMQTYKILGKALGLSLGADSGYETESCNDEPQKWKQTLPEHWSSDDVMDWIYHQAVAHNAHLPSFRGERFQLVDGQKLCQMTERDFTDIDETVGPVLYRCLQECRNQRNSNQGVSDQQKQSWQRKPPIAWQCNEVLDWIYYGSGLSDSDVIHLRGETFQGIDGPQLCAMTRSEFILRDEKFGALLYSALQNVQGNSCSPTSCPTTPNGPRSPSSRFPCKQENKQGRNKWSSNQCLDSATPASREVHRSLSQPSSGRKSQGSRARQHSASEPTAKRPRKATAVLSDGDASDDEGGPQSKTSKQSSKTRLWKFMRDLLDNPEYNPECIRWENKDEGIFRIVAGRSKVIADLWGKIKNNPTMTFDKLGRSLRWCRANNGKFSAVPKDGKFPRKLCFRLVEPDTDELQPTPKIERSFSLEQP